MYLLLNKNIATLTSLGTLLLALAGCKTTVVEDTTVTFMPESGRYQAAQTLTIKLPPTASNIYLTTDTLDPVANNACAYHGENLQLDRATLVKLRFDVQGKTYRHEKLYVIDENPADSHLTNRSVVEAWENFFVSQVYRQMPATGDQNAVHTLTDAEGGTVTRDTRILSRSIFFGIPTSGSQAYRFNFFEKTDADTGEVIMINSGAIYGYRNEDYGFFTTLRDGGERLKFSGTYNGWADGDFNLNADGQTTDGKYTVFCRDYGCAATPVIYALGTTVSGPPSTASTKKQASTHP
jgi:hypothetical protein